MCLGFLCYFHFVVAYKRQLAALVSRHAGQPIAVLVRATVGVHHRGQGKGDCVLHRASNSDYIMASGQGEK